MTKEDRQHAWDAFAAAALGRVDAFEAAQLADDLMKERAKRANAMNDGSLETESQ